MCLKSFISSCTENQWLCKDFCVPHGKVLFDSCSCPGRMLDQRECTARWDEISIFGRTRWNRTVFLWFQKTRAGRTSATLRIEAPMGFEGFYVELLAILLCLVWVWHVRARVDFVRYFAEDYDNCVVHVHECARRYCESRIFKRNRPPSP